MGRLLNEDDVIDTLIIGAELLRRVLNGTDVVGTEREKYEWGLGLIKSCISDVKELPSVQPEVLACGEGELSAEPERKKGKWLIDPLRSTTNDIHQVYRHLRCSECGHQEPWPWLTRRNFCPNCGADMR